MITGNVVKIDTDEKGAIVVWTQYLIDGKEVQSRYPTINGKQVFCSRYSALGFAGRSQADNQKSILDDVSSHVDSLILKQYQKAKNPSIVSVDLASVIGQKVEKDTATLDTPEKTVTLKQEGTVVSTIIK